MSSDTGASRRRGGGDGGASTIWAPIATATSSGERAPIAKPDRGVDPGDAGVADTLGAQALLAVGGRHPAPHRADVDGGCLERGDQRGDVELLVVGEHADRRRSSTGRPEEAVGPVDDELSASGKRSGVTKAARASQTVTR